MLLEEIKYYALFSEIKDKVTEIVLSASDTAELMSYDNCGLQSIFDLYGTEYEDMIPAFISCRSGDNWGMFGKFFKFRLTKELVRHIREEGICCSFREGHDFYMENLCLFRGEKVIFSCLTHEVFQLYGMAEIDDSLNEKITDEVANLIENMPLYAKMQETNRRLAAKSEEEFKRELCILYDLHSYVDREKGAWFYQTPTYECTFREFKKIAKQYLTADTYSALDPLKSFAEFQPLPVANTVDEVLKGVHKDSPQFLQTDYYRKLRQELALLKYVRDKNSA